MVNKFRGENTKLLTENIFVNSVYIRIRVSVNIMKGRRRRGA
jgi:hypothetical protein